MKPVAMPAAIEAVSLTSAKLDLKKIREKYGDRPIRGIPIGLRPQHKPRA